MDDFCDDGGMSEDELFEFLTAPQELLLMRIGLKRILLKL